MSNVPLLNLSKLNAVPNIPGMRSNRYPMSARGTAGRRTMFDFQNGVGTEGLSQTARLAREKATARLAKNVLDRAPPSLAPEPRSKPGWIRFDGIVLNFKGYFLEGVNESPEETARVRVFDVNIFPSDETVQISEVKEENSGIRQGDFVKRTRLEKPPSSTSRGSGSSRGFTFIKTSRSIMGQGQGPATEYYGPKDFDVGKNIPFYGRVMRLVDADGATRAFYRKNYGIDLAPALEVPHIAAFGLRMGQGVKQWKRECEKNGGYFGMKDNAIKRHVEASRGRPDKVHCDAPGGTRHFLKYHGQMLRFNVLWEDSSLYGLRRFMHLNVYLNDNTMEMIFSKGDREGCDPVPALMKRGRFPKPETVNLGARAWRGVSDTDSACYEPTDLRVGATVEMNKRKILIYDADPFTYEWMQKQTGVDMRGDRIAQATLEIPAKAVPQDPVPPNILGIGSEEDTMATIRTLRPRPRRKDEAKLVKYEGKLLRFHAKFSYPRYVPDKERRFVISYFLQDDTLRVFEVVVPNSGMLGGKFVERRKMINPATGRYYAPEDFVVGQSIKIAGFEFDILRCDAFTKAYREGGDDFELHEMHDVEEVEAMLREKIAKAAVNIRKSFRKADKDFSGSITFGEFTTMLTEMGLRLRERDAALLMSKYDADGDGEISYAEFCSAMIAKDFTGANATLGEQVYDKGTEKKMSESEAKKYIERMEQVKRDSERQLRLNKLLTELAVSFFSKGRESDARKAFKSFDVDNSGKVDRYEFACALNSGVGIHLQDGDVELLEDVFYGDGVEEVGYTSFIDFIRSHYVKAGQAGTTR
eukprot:g1915.t1